MKPRMDKREAALERWMQIDTYIVALARRRRRMTRTLRIEPRSEPETPRLMLSTLPFLSLLSILGVLMIAFAIAAWPPSQPRPSALPDKPVASELGNAPPGWFQEAAKEFGKQD